MVLRRKEINAAVLETARGGLLRRGLSMSGCDVAVLTNVAADHLGDYGIDDGWDELVAQMRHRRSEKRSVGDISVVRVCL